MSFSLRSRIAVTALATSAAALLAVLVIVGPALRQSATGRTRETLLAEARLMAHVAGMPWAAAPVPTSSTGSWTTRPARYAPA